MNFLVNFGKNAVALLSTFSLLFISSLLGQVNSNGDVQFWDLNSLEIELKSGWSARFITESRFGDDVSKLYQVYGQMQFAYRDVWCEVAPGFRQTYVKAGRRWRSDSAPMVDITFYSRTNWELEDRSRIFHFIPEDSSSFWIYRNRLRLTSPLFSHFKFYADDEVFFTEREGFHQNRLSGGLFTSLTDNVNARIFYMYRNLLVSNRWTYQNVVSLHLYFNY